MDAPTISSISAGLIVYRIFPVAITAENVVAPFIVYRTVKQDPIPAAPGKGVDVCQIAVDCVATGYREAVELAESVRVALEGDEERELSFSLCYMTDREEFYDDNAYVERLIFTVTI